MIDRAYVHVRGDREETGAHFMRCFFIVWINHRATDLCVSGVCRGENRAMMKTLVTVLSCKITSHSYATYVVSCCLLTACPCACMLGVTVAQNNHHPGGRWTDGMSFAYTHKYTHIHTKTQTCTHSHKHNHTHAHI